MLRLTGSEWKVMEVLWPSQGLPLGAVVDALAPETGWSRTTVHTYLTRMTAKGLVLAGTESPRRYRAAVSREACADSQRRELVERVYRGSASRLVAAFVKDGSLSPAERDDLRRLLDEMEV